MIDFLVSTIKYLYNMFNLTYTYHSSMKLFFLLFFLQTQVEMLTLIGKKSHFF